MWKIPGNPLSYDFKDYSIDFFNESSRNAYFHLEYLYVVPLVFPNSSLDIYTLFFWCCRRLILRRISWKTFHWISLDFNLHWILLKLLKNSLKHPGISKKKCWQYFKRYLQEYTQMSFMEFFQIHPRILWKYLKKNPLRII